MQASSHGERGDTLLELIIAVAIIGIFATALVNVLIESIGSSGNHRSLATTDTLVRSYADDLKQQFELSYQSGGSDPYVPCQTAAYQPTSFSNPQTAPALPVSQRYSVAVTRIEYLKADRTFVTIFGPGAVSQATCLSDNKAGLQRLTVVAQAPGANGASTTLQLLIRDPGYNAGYGS